MVEWSFTASDMKNYSTKKLRRDISFAFHCSTWVLWPHVPTKTFFFASKITPNAGKDGNPFLYVLVQSSSNLQFTPNSVFSLTRIHKNTLWRNHRRKQQKDILCDLVPSSQSIDTRNVLSSLYILYLDALLMTENKRVHASAKNALEGRTNVRIAFKS